MANSDLVQALLNPPQTPQDFYARNQAYTKPGILNYSTQLPLLDEMAFRQWVADNKVPFNPDATGPQDYDMRGFYQALQQNNPRATTGVDPNDSRLHFTDYFKTPYHETFSNQSKFATPMAPQWNELDQLIAPSGRVLFDDRRR